MLSTRQEILEVSRSLFNSHGFTQVSLRMISTKMDISVGNLTYHFKKKDDIVFALYRNLTAKVNHEMEQMDEGNDLIQGFLIATFNYYTHLYEFRFFMLELLYFMKTYPEIQKHFNKISHFRMRQYKELFSKMRSGGYMFHETITGYDNMLFDQLYMHNNYWLYQEAVRLGVVSESSILKGIEDMYGLLLPHLTLAGKRNFKTAMDQSKIAEKNNPQQS